MTALATSQGANQLGNAAALTDGYSAAFLGAAGIAAAGAILAAALLRTPRPVVPADPAEDTEREFGTACPPRRCAPVPPARVPAGARLPTRRGARQASVQFIALQHDRGGGTGSPQREAMWTR